MAPPAPSRLPARVYWVRRGLVVLVGSALATALVLGVVSLVGTAGEEPAADRAATVRSEPRVVQAPVLGPDGPAQIRRRAAAGAEAAPTGECAPQGISTVPSVLAGPGVGAVPDEADEPDAEASGEQPDAETPTVTGIAEAGEPVTIQLALQGTEPACTFSVNRRSVAVKVSAAEGGFLWASQDCPGPLPREEVVVRSGEPTVVTFRWNARDSRSGCGDQALWALPGDYDLQATVQGSSPGQAAFELVRPSAVYVTETPSPEAEPTE